MLRITILCCVAAVVTPARAEGEPVAPPQVVFEDLGLSGFSGAGSVAAALRQVNATAERNAGETIPLDIAVRGPSGSTPGVAATSPLAAEVRSRIERFDVAAGFRADPEVLTAGPAHWTGRIGLKAEDEKGLAALELRTTLGRWETDGRLGVELGPRLERRLRHGATFFIDGKAEAQAVRMQDGGWWALPGTSAADGAGMLGVMARTGLVR